MRKLAVKLFTAFLLFIMMQGISTTGVFIAQAQAAGQESASRPWEFQISNSTNAVVTPVNPNMTQQRATAMVTSTVYGQLTLFQQDYSKITSLPANVFAAEPVENVATTISLTKKASSVNTTAHPGNNGDAYICGLSDQPSSTYNIKLAYDSDNIWSEGYIMVGNIWLGIRKTGSNSGYVTGYYYDGSYTLQGLQFTVPAAVNQPFTLTVISDAIKKSAQIKYNGTLILTVPFWHPGARGVPYPVGNPGFITLNHYACSSGTYSSLDIYSVSQQIARQFITAISPSDIQSFGLDGPHPFNTVSNGINYLDNDHFSGTLWLDATYEWTTNATVRKYYQSLVANQGWETGIHFSQQLATLSTVQADALMSKEYNYVVANFGYKPTSWSCLSDNANVADAVYAYTYWHMIWRSGPAVGDFLPNVNNLCDYFWPWWGRTLGSGMVYPAFTHETDLQNAITYSIDYSKFTQWVDSYKHLNYQITGFNNWWNINNNTLTASFNNVQSNSSKCSFTVQTNGKAFVNIDYPGSNTALKVLDTTSGKQVAFTWDPDWSVNFYVYGGHSYSLTTDPAIAISPATLPAATAEGLFLQIFTASGGTGPYAFTESGALPSGITFKNGVLAGIPKASGSFPITVTATDSYGFSVTHSYALTVNGITIAISPATLPAATAEGLFLQIFTASGGTGPYAFTESGALPSGITFKNGVLAGIPKASGSFPITVTATDSYGFSVTRSYTLKVT